MNWMDDPDAFKVLHRRALDCAALDSGRGHTSLQKMTYDDCEIRRPEFADLLQKLMEWSGDDACDFVVLRPDPVYYFHHFFGKYPVVEFERGMQSTDYLAILDEGPPESRPDALGIIYSEYVFVPPSLRWFMHALRSVENDGGHLWIPSEWVDRVAEVYPYATVAKSHQKLR